MGEEDTTLNVKGLEQLLKALKASPPQARVGILSGWDGRTGKSSSNATIGAAHEFGTSKIPQRSFLRVPITDNLEKYMQRYGSLDQDAMKEVLKTGTVVPWLKKVAQLAEQIVLDAFSSGGFGKWAAWKNPQYTNNTGQLLLDTQQLRNSITSEVK